MINFSIFGTLKKISEIFDLDLRSLRWGVVLLFILFPGFVTSSYLVLSIVFMFIKRKHDDKDTFYHQSHNEHVGKDEKTDDNRNYFDLF